MNFHKELSKQVGEAEIQCRRGLFFVLFCFNTSRRTQKGQWVEVARWESQVNDDGKPPLDSFPVDSL